MNAMLCLHCERAPQSTLPRLRCLRLCDRCGAIRALRRIYRRPRGWTSAWDAHIQQLVEDPLSERILWKEFTVGETIVVDAEGEEILFRSIQGIEPPPVEMAGTSSE